MSSSLLTVDDLHVSYGPLKVLDGASLSVGANEVVTILGSNGAGKTTLLRTIAGLVSHQAGHIRFEGVDIGQLPAHRKVASGLCMVPEGRQLFPDHTVLENLELGAFGRLRNGEKNAVEADMADIFDLFPRVRDRLAQKAGLLSGGEQQMVAIGRSLLSRPRLLMLDEPSLGLAPGLVRSIFQSFLKLKERGIAVLLVEQMAWLGLGICDRAYVLESGKFAIQGDRDSVRTNPRVVEAYLGRVKSAAAMP
jgi:branched-chain amino acid transport system ATP-binding protein